MFNKYFIAITAFTLISWWGLHNHDAAVRLRAQLVEKDNTIKGLNDQLKADTQTKITEELRTTDYITDSLKACQNQLKRAQAVSRLPRIANANATPTDPNAGLISLRDVQDLQTNTTNVPGGN